MKNQGAQILIGLVMEGFHPKEEALLILKHNHGITGNFSEGDKHFTG